MKDPIPPCLALVLALVLAPAAVADDLAQEFEALEQRLLRAQVDADAEALVGLISPDFEYTRVLGDRPLRGFGAEQWQQAVLGAYPLEGFEIHDTRVRALSDRVVQTITRVTLERGGAEAGADGQQRLVTSTWLQGEGDAWRIVARVSVKLGSGIDRQALRAAWRQRTANGPAPGGQGLDREALRAAWRQRLGNMDEAERETLRRRLNEVLQRGAESQPPDEEAAGEETAGEEAAADEPAAVPPPAG